MNEKDFLSIRDFSPQEIRHLLILARQIKAHPAAYSEALKGKTLAMIFEKPSLRTRVTLRRRHSAAGRVLGLSVACGNQSGQTRVDL